MNAEEDDERTRSSIATRSRGAVELKPQKTHCGSSKANQNNKLQSSEPSISQLSPFFSLTCGHKMDSARDASFEFSLLKFILQA